MDYETFVSTVSQRSGLPREQAEALTHATLSTLAERITRGEADDLASELPKGLKESLISPTPEAEGFGLDEFVNRVSRRAQTSPETAREGAAAVLSTVREAVSGGEFRHVMSQLPKEFEELVQMPA
ncbi:DUF2267 domain-containing protein [Streptomyces sp. NPDC005322]|uniref:DUF2267 domain-containing protein n=1 Tax=Streptomyces sp. NPDC005322 TaxID=3157032 RepID=UPI0033B68F69